MDEGLLFSFAHKITVCRNPKLHFVFLVLYYALERDFAYECILSF